MAEIAVTYPSKLVRFPGDLAEKLRLLSLVKDVTAIDILDQMTRGPIEAEFSKLPTAVRALARKPSGDD